MYARRTPTSSIRVMYLVHIALREMGGMCALDFGGLQADFSGIIYTTPRHALVRENIFRGHGGRPFLKRRNGLPPSR